MLTTFWQFWISAIVLGSIIGCGLLIMYTSKGMRKEETDETTGHEYDGIQEIDNPLPRWWVFMFWATIVFGFGYLAMYGLGNFKGIVTVTVDGEEVAWSSTNQWKAEVQAFDAEIAPLYKKYAETPIPELANNQDALQTGQRLFKSNCAVCHGSTAKGALGFPNLTDDDWLYGGAPAQLVHTIAKGRQGAMPAWGAILGDEGVAQMTDYVRSLSGLSHDESVIADVAPKFMQNCAICHGADGKGNIMMGAPNLTDDIWLYGGSTKQINFTLTHGRQGKMPAHQEILGANADAKIHLLATYVYSLSNK
jgi:cytochrome c oxidase cbb3-type subunit 3